MRLVRQLRKELGTSHGTVFRFARRLGYGTESVRAWVRQADIDDSPGICAWCDSNATQQAPHVLARHTQIRRRADRPQLRRAAVVDVNAVPRSTMANQQLFSVRVTTGEDPTEVFRVDRTLEAEHRAREPTQRPADSPRPA